MAIIIILLLIALIASLLFMVFANQGFLNSRDALNDAKALYDAALAELTVRTEQANAAYVSAGARFSEAKTAAQQAQADYDDCLDALNSAKENYENARLMLTDSALSEEEAAADFAEAAQILAEAKTHFAAAQIALTEANSALSAAEQSYADAKDAYDAAASTLSSATENYNEAIRSYENAVRLIQSFMESGGATSLLPTANDIYRAAIDSVVQIQAYNIADIYYKLGSGFFISEDGLIATNYHVIQDSCRLTVSLNDGSTEEVISVVGYDAEIDLAIIRIDKSGCLPLTLASDLPDVGDTIYAIGSTLGLTRSFTKGVVSYVGRELEGFEANDYIQYMGITNSGNSGGPVLNERGEVIGIHQLGDTSYSELGFAIPVSQLDKLSRDKNETPFETMVNNAVDVSDKLIYDVSGGKATITGVSGLIEETVVRIPSTINGYSVTALDWGADSYYAYNIEFLVISENIRTIGSQAFYSMPYLQTICLPSTLETISPTAFAGTTELYQIFLEDGGNFMLDAGVLYDAGKTVMYKYPLCKSYEESPLYETSYTVPSGVRTIGDYAMFYALGLKELILPSSLREISTLGISYCLDLEAVNLPEGLEKLGIGALSTDISLKQVTIPASVSRLGEQLNDGSGYIYKGVFYQCISLASAVFASGSMLSTIGDSLFGYCYDLVSVTDFPSVSSIGPAAFLYCESLASLDLHSLSVTSLGASAFRMCGSLTNVALPSSLTAIEPNTFYGCTALLSADIPAGVQSIGYDAFYACYNLASVTIPSTVTGIGDGAFYYCSDLSGVTLPEGLSYLGIYAFYASGLRSIALPASLKTVEQYAFGSCYNLLSVTLSSGTLWIKTGAFSNCPSLNFIDATACQYAPHLSDADAFLGASDSLQIRISTGARTSFQNDSAWMVYRSHFN